MERKERKKTDTVRDEKKKKDKRKKKKCAIERGDLREARGIRKKTEECGRFYRKN